MANHRSAVKRNIQNQKRRMRNRMMKTRVKSAVKIVLAAEKEGDAAALTTELNNAKSIIDKAAKKGVLHKKTAARRISRLSRRANRALNS